VEAGHGAPAFLQAAEAWELVPGDLVLPRSDSGGVWQAWRLGMAHQPVCSAWGSVCFSAASFACRLGIRADLLAESLAVREEEAGAESQRPWAKPTY
jgi:hypothetical protein